LESFEKRDASHANCRAVASLNTMACVQMGICRTATVAALPARGLYVVSHAASVSRIVAWPTFAAPSGKARGASNIGGLFRHRAKPRTNPGGSAESGRGIRRGILGVAVR
jgi:hypothetical protein